MKLILIFRTNMVVYTLEQRWKILRQIDLQKIPILAKKNHLLRWNSFWSWRVCKQAKLLHLGHRKPACIHWKADASKTSHCLSKERQLHSMVITIEPCWTNFCSQKFKRRIMATFGFNRTATRATESKIHSMFCALFLKIALNTAELMLFDQLGAAIWRRWTIICGVPSKVSVTPTSRRKLTL